MQRRCKIIAKAALSEAQINVKRSIGCDGIEIQLLNELKGIGDHEWLDANSKFNLTDFIGKNIEVVHAPILKSAGDTLIEWIADLDDMKLLDQVFYIANFIGEMEQRDIRVIFHSETSVAALEDTAQGFTRIAGVIKYMLEKYPFTILCIENVTPFRGLDKGGVPRLANNYYCDNVEMVKALREYCYTKRIGVVLDTCHQGITEMYMNKIYDLAPEYEKPDFSLEHYFKEYSPYLEIVHLSDFDGCGYGKGKHGISFEDWTFDKLCEVLDLKEKYSPKSLLTLEVEETDFSVCNGYRETKRLVDKYYEKDLTGKAGAIKKYNGWTAFDY